MSGFCGNLYRALNKDVASNENLFFSPYSVHMCMSMIVHGAGGESRSQLLKALDLEGTSADILADQKKLSAALGECRDGVELNIANKLFPSGAFSIREAYTKQLVEALGCKVEAMNYEQEAESSRKQINHWVERATKDKIKDLLGAGTVSALTRLVLVNAVYFKGLWSKQFSKNNTNLQDFYNMDGSVKQVQMMSREAGYLTGYDEALKVRCIELPYRGNRLSMCVFLPDERCGLARIENELTATGRMDAILGSSKLEKVVLRLPRFKIEYAKTLNDVLQSMGIADVFDHTRADLTGMSDEPDLSVTHVAHKAFVEVNEEGTEAAAATGLLMNVLCLPLPPLEFTCNHSFLFTIRHNQTKQVLFLGKVASLVE